MDTQKTRQTYSQRAAEFRRQFCYGVPYCIRKDGWWLDEEAAPIRGRRPYKNEREANEQHPLQNIHCS